MALEQQLEIALIAAVHSKAGCEHSELSVGVAGGAIRFGSAVEDVIPVVRSRIHPVVGFELRAQLVEMQP